MSAPSAAPAKLPSPPITTTAKASTTTSTPIPGATATVADPTAPPLPAPAAGGGGGPPATRGRGPPQGEGDQVHPPHVHSQRRAHLAVVDDRQEHLSAARSPQRPCQQPTGDYRDEEERNVVERIGQAAQLDATQPTVRLGEPNT